MVFMHELFAVLALLALTLILQSAGMAGLIQWAKAHLPRNIHRFGRFRASLLVVRLTCLIVCLHTLQILLWAWFYRWNCFPRWESAIYFSTSSYSTMGASDLALPLAWRTLGPAESAIGVLMFGLSASFLFAVVTRLVDRDIQADMQEALADSRSALALAQANAGKESGLPSG